LQIGREKKAFLLLRLETRLMTLRNTSSFICCSSGFWLLLSFAPSFSFPILGFFYVSLSNTCLSSFLCFFSPSLSLCLSFYRNPGVRFGPYLPRIMISCEDRIWTLRFGRTGTPTVLSLLDCWWWLPWLAGTLWRRRWVGLDMG